MIWHDQRPVEGLKAAGHCALLPCLLAFIDALVQAIDAHYTVHQCVFGRHRRHPKKDKAEKAVERRAADQHDMVSGSFPDPFRPYS